MLDKVETAGSDKVIIKPMPEWNLSDLVELKAYRDLFYFLVWRDIKVLYAQTILGFSWAIFQPLIQIVVFSLIFGRIAKINTDGIPYVLFSTVAIIPWTYLNRAISKSSASLVNGQHMLGKIYFPRLIFPLTPILSVLVDFGISMMIVVAIIFYYGIAPTSNLLYFPFFIVLMMCIAAGAGFWLSAMAIRYRDVKHAMPFAIRMLMYTAPIVYPASSIPDKWTYLYACNPIAGFIEGFRACFLGTAMPWSHIWPGIITTFILLISGLLYFKRMERVFVDVI